ncbi:DUF7940 domain-containing protein [Rhizobiales bacterium 3FA27D7]|uniref:DUF7940 domain-containing protein n=1 Tax=Mesorhizobium sp. 2RAF21 TaxID=3232995 RepID=UPI0010F8014B
MPRLVTNWRAVLRYAWTVRLALLAAILNGAAVTVSIITGSLPVAPMWLAALNGVLAVAVPVVRIIDQSNLKDDDNE